MKPHKYTSDHHCIRPSDLDPLARSIIERLSHHGYTAYLVGGGVRDILLRKKPKDLDIATDATPRAIKSLFRNSRIIGRRFKLAQIFFGRDKIFEVSTFRDFSPIEAESIEQDSVEKGDPKIGGPVLDDNCFGTEETDARRRDLTINALFFDPISSTIIDYVGGIEDIRSKLVRIIGDPDVRIAEDPVRMIRVIRHAARSGFAIEKETADSVLKNRQLIHQCTDVRVFDEIRKDLSSGHFLKIARLLGSMKVLEALLPEIDTTILDNHTPFSEAMERVDDAILNGDSFDLYLPLTLIALYSRSPIGADKWGCAFSDNAEVEIYLSRFFSKMAVPKKEKERISSTIRILKELLSDGLSGDFKGEKWSIKALEDVIAILRILPSSGHDRLLYKLLKDAIRGDRDGSKNIPIDISEQQGRRRRQRRRGGRKGHATKAVGNL